MMQERQFQWVLREYGGQETIPTRALLNYLQMEAQVRLAFTPHLLREAPHPLQLMPC